MTTDLAIILALLAAAIVMFIANRPRMDAVALIMITAMPATGVITMPEALAGFADGSIVLIAALFVIGDGLVRTGVAQRMGDWLVATAGNSETRLMVLLMVAVAGLGAFMSSTAVVAIFIPIVLRICGNTGIAPSRLMMPLSMAALISGLLTLVATAPNLMVHAELLRRGFEGFGFFSITPFGLPILALGVGYMLVARRLLPTHAPATPRGQAPTLADWITSYDLAAREHRVRIGAGSSLVGARIDQLDLRAIGADILAIERRAGRGTSLVAPGPATELQEADVLLVDLVPTGIDIAALRQRYTLESVPLAGAAPYFADHTQQLGMVEVLLPPDSALVGRSVAQARVRAERGLTVVGLRRGGKVFGADMLQQTLAAGDMLLLVGFWRDIERLSADRSDLVLLHLPAEFAEVLPAPGRAPHALAALAVTVGLMASGLIPNVQAAFLGCLIMGATGCVDMTSAYRSISWKTIVLIVGMLPFSIALQRTGGVDLAADALVALVGGAAPRIVLASLFVITSALGLFISNTATAVLMAPVAIAIAQDLGVSPYPFAMVVAIASSAAFMTPVSSPVNTLVVAPGGYGFGDFLKVGVPFTLVVLVVTIVLVPIILPL